MNACIFVVDDDPSVRAQCHVYLRGLGCEVVAWPRGAEALAAFEEQHGRVALLVADIGPGGLRRDLLLTVFFERKPQLRAILLGEPAPLGLPGQADDRVAFEPKPIVAEQLAAQARTLLAIPAPVAPLRPERRPQPRSGDRGTRRETVQQRARAALEDALYLREQAVSYRQLALEARDADTSRLWSHTARKADEMAALADLVAASLMA